MSPEAQTQAQGQDLHQEASADLCRMSRSYGSNLFKVIPDNSTQVMVIGAASVLDTVLRRPKQRQKNLDEEFVGGESRTS
ncbi:hypothetical protein E5288_WYG005112 [Bos mutus]|uniref:Uncharacterized protein n=1 Tax=Bos mutus TaxID=72004 RepID=A0A6B0RZ38_9CETA|nr:hypothetical protein [Bos mutus]